MNQKGFALIFILIGVLLLALVGGGAFYFSRLSDIKSQPQNYVITSQTLQPTVVPSEQNQSQIPPFFNIVSSQDATNWKIYKNDYWKFQFKYPPTWSFINYRSDNDTKFQLINFDYEANLPQTQEEALSMVPIKVPGRDEEFSIAINIDQTNSKTDVYFNQLQNMLKEHKAGDLEQISDVKQVKIDSQKGTSYDFKTFSEPLSIHDVVFETPNGFLITFRFWRHKNNLENIPTFFTILSTFKFL